MFSDTLILHLLNWSSLKSIINLKFFSFSKEVTHTHRNLEYTPISVLYALDVNIAWGVAVTIDKLFSHKFRCIIGLQWLMNRNDDWSIRKLSWLISSIAVPLSWTVL
ncbi:hypothetical protein MN116_005349 [Schistosoma mekongi]|uniref:Uncharacterized protein n=1 Tax=Schistosoma mekongi TaxID=38744 RepID=A0AAE2D5D1_SCHME|nr:hypothetical protein MN116_005349 [Schistosoma mekongi]